MKLIFKLLAVFLLSGIGTKAYAQHKPMEEMRKYFSGYWEGVGKFGDGQAVRTTLVFSADSTGMVSRHRDVPPAICTMDGRWSIRAKSGKVSLWLTDNTGKGKMFEGDGLRGGLMVVSATFCSSGDEKMGERYTYTILGSSSFRVSYEVCVMGRPWRQVDYMIFRRKK